MKSTHKKVQAILDGQPKLVNSDKKLLLAFWRQEGLFLTREQENRFMDCTPAETITRARRHLQLRYLPYMEPSVVRERGLKQDQFAKALNPRAVRRPQFQHSADGTPSMTYIQHPIKNLRKFLKVKAQI